MTAKLSILLLLLFPLAKMSMASPEDSVGSLQPEIGNIEAYENALQRIEELTTYDRMGHHNRPSHEEAVDLIVLIALLAVTLIVLLFIFFRYKMKRSEHEVVLKALEQDKDVPLDFMRKKKRLSNSKTGITLLGLGMGLVITMLLMDGAWPLGFVLMFLGGGLLLGDRLFKD